MPLLEQPRQGGHRQDHRGATLPAPPRGTRFEPALAIKLCIISPESP